MIARTLQPAVALLTLTHSDFFTPDSIGAPGSTFDIEELIEDTLGRTPYFGESKVEQSDYRKDQYNDLVRSAEQGASVSGNTFLRAYLSQGIEEFAFADYVYFPEETASRIPTLYEHFVQMQDYSALPIWRPKALINCKYKASDDKGGIERHDALARQNGVLGMVVHAEGTAPSVACFLYGTHDNGHFIELLGQYQYLTENKEEHNQFWILHACIFRCAFGHNTAGEMIDPTTGIWTSTGDEEPSMLNAVAPASDEVLASTFDHQDVCILPVQGSTEVESCDAFKPTTGSDRLDVRRMGLAECRVAVFHISSYAWRNAYEETCRRWAGFLTQCLVHQVDFVQGDGNLFAQRNFKRDVHSDYRTCILVDILSRVLTEINMHRTPTNRITYNICSSTMQRCCIS